MKKLRIVLISMTLSILPMVILNGQNSLESQSNKSSNNSNITRYTNITEISYGIGFSDSKGHSSFGIHTINGCLFNSTLSLGLGIGLDRLHIDKNVGETILPISLDIRYYFLNDPKILFFDVEGGYIYNLTCKKQGYSPGLSGFFINPSIGAKVISIKKVSIVVSLGIKIQESNIIGVWMPTPKNATLINLKTGIKF